MRCSLILVALLAGTAHADNSTDKLTDKPVDFIADAKLYYRVVTCMGTEPVPAHLDAATVDKHCAEMQKRYASITERYLTPAGAFFKPLRPVDLPTTIVYPFGGGDLMSALVTYPDAREINTISLEHAGDPTRLAKLDTKHKLAAALTNYRNAVAGLLSLHDSTSENMRKLESGGIPGQLSFHLTGMAVNGYEPVSLKYVRVEPDGTLHYLTEADIAALAKTRAKKKKGSWVDTDFSEAYTHMELAFRKAGDAKAPLVVHRHFAWNLNNQGFVGTGLDNYLTAKGKVAAMTKAASYLIWNSGFSRIRDYLTTHMVWMVSDATGVAPVAARKAGFTQITYGTFKGAFLEEADPGISEQMAKMWASQPHRKLPFRYGYPDAEKHVHLMITQRAEPKK
ncbi:MAG: hypothetical protein WKG01_03500 [Kofleriaceae bacterium]